MKFFNFLNDIDWSKNTILFIIYILVVLFCLAFYFIPIMQNHKIQTLDYKRIQNLNAAIAQNENSLQQNMDSVLKENAHQNIRNKVDMQELENYIKKYINDAAIIDNGIQDSTNNIEIQNIAIQGYTKDTKKIIDFINNLGSLNSSIRIGFPIDITKQGNNLKVNLYINIYYSDYEL